MSFCWDLLLLSAPVFCPKSHLVCSSQPGELCSQQSAVSRAAHIWWIWIYFTSLSWRPMISRWASCYNKWRSWCAMSITLTADGASRVCNNNSNIHAHTHTLRTSRGNVLQFYDRLLALGERASEFITQMTYCGALKVCALPVNVSRNCSQHPGPPTHDKIAGASR